MQPLLIRVLESSAGKYLIFPAHKRSERSHGNHRTKCFVFSSKQLLKTLGPHSLRRNMSFSTAIGARNQADNVPQRKKSDMMSQLELENSEAFLTRRRSVNGIFWLLLLNIGIYVADHWFQFWPIKLLYLYHDAPRWYQFITATFCHVNWSHLSSNLFFLYIFGKLVEEEEGGFALWLSYLLTGAGANLVSWMILPRTIVSVGASGAVFGLFAISVLIKISWDWRKILEVLILGQFVVEKVASASIAERNWSTDSFIHSIKRNKLHSKRAKNLIYVHSNLRFLSHKQNEYKHGEKKVWDIEPEHTDLDASSAQLIAFNDLYNQDEQNISASDSGTGCGSSNAPPSSMSMMMMTYLPLLI